MFLPAAMFLFLACVKDDNPSGTGELPDVKENTIVVNGVTYTLNDNGARYYSGMYPFMGLECTNFYIECSRGAGITIEVDESLVGETIPFEQGDTFWFFAIGNGNGMFAPLQHDTVKAEDTGWFRIERNLKTNYCTLLFELNYVDKKGVHWEMAGKFRRTFGRLTSL